MAYRSHDHVFEALKIEQSELDALRKGSRDRRLRAASVLAGLFVLFFVVAALGPAALPAVPKLRCHRVEVEWQRTPGDTPPPPMSWDECERR